MRQSRPAVVTNASKLRAAALVLLCLALTGAAPRGAAARQMLVGLFSSTEGPVYPVHGISLEYAEPSNEQPPIESLMAAEYALGKAADGYVGPRRGGRNVWFALSELETAGAISLYGTGLRELNEQIVVEINKRGLIGVFVAPHRDDIDPATGVDLRPPERTRLRLVIQTGHVVRVRSIASGERFAEEPTTDQAAHEGIRENSPLQVAGAGGVPVLRQDALDEYTAKLSRHPGRRVDVALTPAADPGGVMVDYLVAEEKPWRIYGQTSNTGTDETSDWRQRMGFVHNQLTGRDDILRFDYITDMDDVNASLVSYEAPFPVDGERVRWRVNGLWSSYDASVIGSPNDFEGDTWLAGGQLIANAYQRRDLFVDLVAGAEWINIETKSLGPDGDADLFMPAVGVQLEQIRPTSALWGSLRFEQNLPSVADTPSGFELARLGRPDVDDDPRKLEWDAVASFYLEPLLHPRAWNNPRSASSSTLAHELFFQTRGQYAFNNRLIPQLRMPVGGFYSVRGYQQSVTSGDTVVMGRAEYRYHYPMSLRPNPRAAEVPLLGRFRVAPPQVYGRPDWDLVLSVFYDIARVIQSDAVAGEFDETLSGTGFGVELLLRRNLSLRFDLGVALDDTENGEVESGDTEGHFTATIKY